MTKAASQAQKAVVILREMILTNELLPGSMHLESELAEMLEMSRTPVREAAIMLEGHGLLEILPRRGIKILPLSKEDMEEVYEILTELESLAAAKLAQRSLRQDELDRLEAPILEMESALESDDRRRWAAADARFHSILVSMAGSGRLQSIVSTFSDQVHRARLLTLFMRPAPHKSNEDHRALVKAIADGDPEAANAIHRRHRIESKFLMAALIEENGLKAV